MESLDALLGKVAQGDLDALGTVYRALRTAVYSTALAIVGDPSAAEEVLHDAIVRVYERAKTYRPGSNPRAWIIAIARNLAYDRLRSLRRESAAGEPEPALQAGEPADVRLVSTESAALDSVALAAALDCLDLTDREIVTLYAVADLSHREIAAQLGIPQGTVRWRYRRALRRLAGLIEGEEGE